MSPSNWHNTSTLATPAVDGSDNGDDSLSSSISQWSSESHFRSKRCFRQPIHPDIDGLVIKWYERCLRDGQIVNGPEIQKKAKEYALQLGIINFKASNGWLVGFKLRNNIDLKSVKRELRRNSGIVWTADIEDEKFDDGEECINPLECVDVQYDDVPVAVETADRATSDIERSCPDAKGQPAEDLEEEMAKTAKILGHIQSMRRFVASHPKFSHKTELLDKLAYSIVSTLKIN